MEGEKQAERKGETVGEPAVRMWTKLSQCQLKGNEEHYLSLGLLSRVGCLQCLLMHISSDTIAWIVPLDAAFWESGNVNYQLKKGS